MRGGSVMISKLLQALLQEVLNAIQAITSPRQDLGETYQLLAKLHL